MANQRCATCRNFSQQQNGPEITTICEREGPKLFSQPFPVGEGRVVWASMSAWPQVNASNGCPYHVPDIVVRN